MSTIRVNAIQDSAGVERYTARAWVNCNGTGTVAIRASGNVSSITDNGTGNYTVNLAAALADANHSVVATASYTDSGSNMATVNIQEGGTYSTSAVQLVVQQASGTNYDSSTVSVAIFR